MAKVWDAGSASWVEQETAPVATTPASTAPTASAAPPETDGWSGGFWSDLKHVAGGVPKEAGQIGRSLTHLPSQLVAEVNKGVNFVTGGVLEDQLLKTVPGQAEGVDNTAGPKTFDELTPSNVLQAPIVNLLPGAFTADKIANDPSALAEHPLTAALDVLPFVGKAGKVATKGSDFATQAATRAESIGRLAKADRIANEGMKLPEIAQEVTRRAEARIVEKFPSAYGKTPSAVMERAGLGGERARQALQMSGTRSRAYTKDVIDEQARILAGTKEWESRGVDPATQSKLLADSELADRTWWDSLPDEHRGFLRWFENQSDELFHQYDKSKTFEFGNERYTAAQAPTLYKHYRRMETIRGWMRSMDQRMDPAHPKHPKSPEAVEALRKRGALMEQRLTVREGRAKDAAATAPPARFSKVINNEMRPGVERLVEEARAVAEAEGVKFPLPEEAIRNLVESGSYRQLQRSGIISDDALRSVAREVSGTWQELRAKGLDPMYNHHVPASRRARLATPRFDPVKLMREPSAIKRRGWDMEPWVPEASVSLLDQAVDLIQSKHAATWMDEMQANGMLKSAEDVTAEVGNAAQRIVSHLNPLEQQARLPEIMQQLQERLYVGFDTRGFRPTKMTAGADSTYIPKGIAKVIEGVTERPRLPGLTRLPMRAFRASVLYLNPGYYVGNSIGNAMMLSARGSPMDLRFLPKAFNAWRKGELPIEISMGSVLGTADESFKAGLHKMGWQAIDDLDATVWSKTADRAGRAEAFLQRFAGALDDMTKATAYFSEFEKAGKKGANADLAIARAVEHMNKVNMGMDTLLPMERAVMRGVLMPFYSWSKFALGYIMSYPFDHPWRAAVISSLGRQVREEWDERLPERLMGYWAVGEQDGKTKLYPASGIYPFLSFFSTDDIWTGALRRLSPILQVAQEYSGIDPMSGGPNPYGSYDEEQWEPDPVSGKPRYRRPKLTRLLSEAFLPHTEMIFSKLDPKQQEYYKKNPGRYFEDTMRSFGITVPMTRDLDEERSKYAKVVKEFGGPTIEAAPAKTPEPVAAPAGKRWNPETASWE